MSQFGIPKVRQTSSETEPTTVRCGHVQLQAGERTTNTRSTGPREALYGLIPGWHKAKPDVTAVPHAGLGYTIS